MEHATPASEEASPTGQPVGLSRRMNRGLLALWTILIVIVLASFAALLYFGAEVYQMAPPIPETVASTDGEVIFTGDDLR